MKLKQTIVPAMGLAGMGIGLGLIADNFTAQPEIVSGLAKAGATSTSFVAPAISIMAGGYVINQLRELRPKHNHGGQNGLQDKKKKTNFRI